MMPSTQKLAAMHPELQLLLMPVVALSHILYAF